MSLNHRKLMNVAAEAAEAGAGALSPFLDRERALAVEEKALHDFVTDADRASERAVIRYISERFPKHRLMCEEGTKDSFHGSTPTWIIDPLDGTTNFIHRFGVFSISVACAVEGEVLAGAVYDPSRRELFAAARGHGAFLNGERIHISGRSGLRGSLIATGFPFRRLERLDPYLASFRAIFKEVAGIRRAGSAAIDLACVACGRFDGFWEEGLSPWDMAAGTLLIEEAGGCVSDFRGGDHYLDTGAVIAGSTETHAAIRERIEPHQGDGCGTTG